MRKYFLFAAIACVAFLFLSNDSEAVRFGEFEIHPILAVTEQFTDNVFNTNTDRQSDFSTVITPGVQIIFPKSKKRYELEVIYHADIERFSKFKSENAVSHTAVARVDVILPAGIEFHGNDEFKRGHDPRGVNIGPDLDFYKSNMGTVSVAYSLSDRFKARFDYTNFIMNYDADRNDFRDRTDNGIAQYLYYRFLPKTSGFVEYDYVVIDYTKSDELNSKEQHFYGGVTWDITGKTKGTIKGGYGIKNFENSALSGYRGSIMEAIIDHNFNTRDSLKIRGIRTTNETNNTGSDFFVTTGLSLEYLHKFTGKITGKITLSYGRDDYHGDVARRDDTWEGGIGLIYQIKKWLRAEVNYNHTRRNSDIEVFSYTNNTYYLRVTATP